MKKTFALLLVLITSNLTFSQNVPSYVPTNGLVGWWSFNGNANDISGVGNNGTVYGATQIAGRDGAPNSAYSFNGTSDFINIPDNNSLDFTNSFSISIWMRITEYANGNERVALGKQRAIDATGYQISAASANSQSRYGGCVNNNIQYSVWSPDSLALNKWEFVVLTYGSGLLKLYKNGVLMSTISTSISLNNSALPLFFGKEFSSSRYFKGGLDDIGMWNRALAASEVSNLFFSCTSDTITSNPPNINGNKSNNISIPFTHSGTGWNFQWQSNSVGLGWQNVPNAGQYSGVNTNTLTVNNLSVSNHNQLFRVVSSKTGCNSDTTATAKLTISNIASDSSRLVRLIGDSTRLTIDSITRISRINKLLQDSGAFVNRIIKLSNDSVFYANRIVKLTNDSNIFVSRINNLKTDSINKETTINILNTEIATKSNVITFLQTDTTNKGATIRSLELALANKHDTVYVSSVITQDTLRISITTGIAGTSPMVNKLLVYPNPAATHIHIDLLTNGTYKATLSGVSGQTLITPTSGVIDVSNLANGVYILSIYDTQDKLITQNKVVILR